MRIVAKLGDNRILVDVGNGQGFVANTLVQIRYETKSILDITKFGSWRDEVGTQKLLTEIQGYKELKS